jgi:hypothetical protein
MEFQFTYLYMGLVFSIIWLLLFLWRKNTRKEMLTVSIIFALPGPIANLIYIQDWWKPLTITKTPIGLEGLIVGFMIGGIASVIYEDFFKKRVKLRKVSKAKEHKRNLNLFYLLSSLAIIFFGSFYLLKFNSLIATILTLVIPTGYIWIKRPDLIKDSLITGILLVLVASIVYTILEFLTPGWITAFWYFQNTPDIILFNLPLDDIIWYFLAGLFIGPLYEFWQEGKLTQQKS